MKDLLNSIKDWADSSPKNQALFIAKDSKFKGMFANIDEIQEEVVDTLMYLLLSNPCRYYPALSKLCYYLNNDDLQKFLNQLSISSEIATDLIHNLGFKIDGE